jgi:hypothetical protein
MGTRGVDVYATGKRGPRSVLVEAFLAEKSEGVWGARGVRLVAGSGAFRWDFKQGKATLRPPAPFTGSATFTRGGNGSSGTWKGSLGMPILGGDPVRIAGTEFRAFVHRGLPQDE